MNESTKYRIARIVAGIIFMLAGAFKLLAARGDFAQLLAWANLPFPVPQVISYAVPLLEIIGGAALLADRQTRAFASLLAYDMAAAIVLISLPALSGHVYSSRGYVIGNEVWRLPLEIVLLILCVWLSMREIKRVT